MSLIALVLAAGHGTRMKSALPKVLHPACGRPLVYYPVRAALDVGADRAVVVVNPQTRESIAAELGAHIPQTQFSTALQEVPRGTGDAARAALDNVHLDDEDRVLIVNGDVPLLEAHDLTPLLAGLEQGKSLVFMTFFAEDPSGYGRVLRDAQGRPLEIREHRDLENDAQRSVREVNAGVYAVKAGALGRALALLSPRNAQGEYYLTDIVAQIAAAEGPQKVGTTMSRPEALAGVNDRSQLAKVERLLFARIAERLAERGVSIVGTPLIDDTVVVESDARIEDGVRLRGRTRIGAGTLVDVGTVIQDTTVGKDVHIKPYCVLSDSQVGDAVQLGPFAHLRPGSILEDESHIGNFVETKNTRVKRGAKANHLTYLGDAEIGEKSNIGAGTIVCNYDGFRKQKTTIGKGVFVGSDSQLIAPLTIGDGAYVATATTVNRDVPEGALAIGRSRQQNKDGYASVLRERLQRAARAAKANESDG